MRGAHDVLETEQAHAGIIPADAGSTQKPEFQIRLSGDHPRGCGEHDPPQDSGTDDTGSSPRMRGALFTTMIIILAFGIIPADAGSTRHHSHTSISDRDHPRGCGEHKTVERY